MARNPDEAQIGATVRHQSDDGLSPFRALAESASTEGGELVDRVSLLIEQTRAVVASQANAALTLMNWRIGRMVDVELLKESRAGYGQEIVASLGQQLGERFGRGFDRTNLTRMVRFAQQFPDPEIVAPLAQQLSWTHFKAILPVKTPEARAFYIDEAIARRLSVRELRHVIERKAFERREIADSQIPEGSAIPLDAFRDPMLLDMLGLHDSFRESELEEAIVRALEPVLLEVGRGWAFIERQKRMTFDGDDYHLDLLFFSRPLRRLIAVELKIGKFKPSYKGQMDFYLKWLNRYERQEDEHAPIGLILCTEASREQIELLEMHKDGIVVAEYWTTLPPKAELQARIQAIYREAQERITRRQLIAASEEDIDE
ncbi:PDDEXK nuclease domain-containing protein [Tessaracoccus caeni]|uniref:PDDEXK nuclease domain-containing protein n=1 Tax=Tessaracoccus caeni TaxID=3031239 RepID=UPI0023DABCBB|nr:PDDEXK nuclease domain-containing protein [Tessaracoccus caeni]MDF1489852.1 PDDEXK nuclease domain-containing protein [Tessaracoccus caeni]